MTGSRLFQMVLVAQSALLSLIAPQVLYADSIGNISELKGYAQVLRDKPYGAELEFDIQQMDDVRTGYLQSSGRGWQSSNNF